MVVSMEREIAVELALEPVVVGRALGELERAGLLEGPGSSGYSRREAVGRLTRTAGAALAVPLVYSVAVPAAAAALSCIANGGTDSSCTAGSGDKASASACCSGTCYHGSGSTMTCVVSTCGASGAFCLTNSACCSNNCNTIFHSCRT